MAPALQWVLMRAAGKVALGVAMGWELKDVFKDLAADPKATREMLPADRAKEIASTTVAIVKEHVSFWAQIGRMIGITLATIEVGRLSASHLKLREAKAADEHLHELRREAEVDLRQLETTESDSRSLL